jgi:hypothetical protein
MISPFIQQYSAPLNAADNAYITLNNKLISSLFLLYSSIRTHRGVDYLRITGMREKFLTWNVLEGGSLMRIGFDLDGVIADLDSTRFRLLRYVDFPDNTIKNEFKESIFGGLQLRVNWNPEELIAKGDEYHIITARHSPMDTQVTFEWCKKYCPNAKSVNIVGYQGDDWEIASEAKAAKIKELKIEVFFEDNPRIAKRLRKLCPETKIIQVGGRFIY